jgi:hypothetical protein
MMFEMSYKGLWPRFLNGSFQEDFKFKCLIFDISGKCWSRENAISAFNSHNELVKSLVPHERLLVFRASDGWKPLCEFLHVPIPDAPFPHLNESDTFRQLLFKMRAAAIGLLLLMFLVAIFLLRLFVF